MRRLFIIAFLLPGGWCLSVTSAAGQFSTKVRAALSAAAVTNAPWPMERVVLRDGRKYDGYIESEDDVFVHLIQIRRRKGQPMHLVIRTIQRSLVEETVRLDEPQRAKLRQRIDQFRNRAQIEKGRESAIRLGLLTRDGIHYQHYRGKWFTFDSNAEEAIVRRVDELAGQISSDYGQTGEIVLVGVLKGAFIFLADLARRLTIDRRIEFIALSSYPGGARSGAVRLLMDMRCDIRGRHVLVVEDIVDTGSTLRYLLDMLGAREPASLRCCALVRKKERLRSEVEIRYLGFDIPDHWVVGYGLDYRERYRTLPYIGIMEFSEEDGPHDG